MNFTKIALLLFCYNIFYISCMDKKWKFLNLIPRVLLVQEILNKNVDDQHIPHLECDKCGYKLRKGYVEIDYKMHLLECSKKDL